MILKILYHFCKFYHPIIATGDAISMTRNKTTQQQNDVEWTHYGNI